DVGIFDIADRVGDLLHIASDALVALAADTDRPVDRVAFARPGLPRGADLPQIVGEIEAGARAVGTMDHRDIRIGKLNASVDRANRRVVPLLDLAGINIGKQRAGKLQLAGHNSGD